MDCVTKVQRADWRISTQSGKTWSVLPLWLVATWIIKGVLKHLIFLWYVDNNHLYLCWLLTVCLVGGVYTTLSLKWLVDDYRLYLLFTFCMVGGVSLPYVFRDWWIIIITSNFVGCFWWWAESILLQLLCDWWIIAWRLSLMWLV